MDKLQKFLLKLTKKERTAILNIMADFKTLRLTNYDIKPLQGFKNYYRLRKGKIRIVYTIQNEKAFIINIAYRKDIYK